MPRRTKLSRAPRPKVQQQQQAQGFVAIPNPARRDEPNEIKGPAHPTQRKPPIRGDERGPSGAPPRVGMSPNAVAAAVGISLAVVGGSLPAPSVSRRSQRSTRPSSTARRSRS
jgi:hypothetical protein